MGVRLSFRLSEHIHPASTFKRIFRTTPFCSTLKYLTSAHTSQRLDGFPWQFVIVIASQGLVEDVVKLLQKHGSSIPFG